MDLDSDRAWRDGVDRWFEQFMKRQQLELIVKYFEKHPLVRSLLRPMDYDVSLRALFLSLE